MIARSSILSVLDNAIVIGQLSISDSEGIHHYGRYQKGCNKVHLSIVNDNFWFRILLYVVSFATRLYTQMFAIRSGRSSDLGCK